MEFVLVLLVLLAGCNDDQGLDDVTRQELSRHEVHDELFLGTRFGQSQKQFFDHCRQLNKQGLFSQGAMGGQIAVDYQLDELVYPALMSFYPTFTDGKITSMEVRIKYKSWAPWNKHLYADQLLPDVLQLLKKWHGGNDFREYIIDDRRSWFKHDGNRRIQVRVYDEVYAQVLYTDMRRNENHD